MGLTQRERESRTETVLPARGLSGLQAAEQWQETSAWNFSLRTGMRAPYPGVSWPRAALRSTETSLSVGSSGRGLLEMSREGERLDAHTDI